MGFINKILNELRVRKIRKDLTKALQYQIQLSEGQEENFEVLRGNYLEPETSTLVLPIKHPHGKYMYYKEILDGLESLLRRGFPNIRVIQSNSPNYVLGYAKTLKSFKNQFLS